MVTNVLTWLEATAARKPEAIAFSGPDERLDFRTLKLRASVLGTRLAQHLPPRRAAAVILDKSCGAVVAFMGTVYAGGFYSFIDRIQPVARMQMIIDQMNPGVIITNEKCLRQVQELTCSCPVLMLPALEQGEADESLLLKIRAEHIDTDPLYCNFTSGSSGMPKGVLVCHRSVIDFIEVFTDTFGFTEEDVLGNQAPFDSDVSVKDIYTGLKVGAEVVIIPKSYFSFLKDLLQLLEDRKVTTLIWVVSALCLISTIDGLAYLRPSFLKCMMLCGEVMPGNHLGYWQKHYPNARFVNLYGPTEITCNCTYHIIGADADQTAPIPIGKPFQNERVFLLDEQNRQIETPGLEGEICVSGTAVTIGYYNDPERTAKAFVQNPLNTTYPETVYRTGDLAKYGADGLLYFVGRRDFQVKHHGRRVELGEIEAALAACGARRACVLYMDREERIIAYVITEQEPAELYKALKRKLPDYMIPAEIIKVETLPLTSNGKLDRKALQESWRKHKAEHK
ncbi:MAG: amino acid adenylation domain-containing protein [Bacillota bacterium]